MPFEPASQFIFSAAKKYNLHKQAASGIVIQIVLRIIRTHHKEYTEFWIPKKFENGKLTIETTNSTASSALFMKTHALTESINENDLPQKVLEIVIQKASHRELRSN